MPPSLSDRQSHIQLADERRAAEIANADIGLAEFIELTGVGSGRYGMYDISASGVVAHDCRPEDVGDIADPGDQLKIIKVGEMFALAFPSKAADFVDWYEKTKGTNGISDFNIAPGFLKAVLGERASKEHLGQPVTSKKIANAFPIVPVPSKNKEWWDTRMRSAKKYGLKDFRAAAGRAKRMSMWHPKGIASWLIEQKHLSRNQVLHAMKTHFPDVDTDYL